MPDLLLELFSEEIPARMQRQAAEDLKRLVTNALVERNLLYEGAQSFVTPRRLTLHVVGLPPAQPDLREERKGPRVGAPDAAIQGFLKSAGLERIEDARIETDPKKGAFYVALIEKPGRDTKDAIAEIMPAIIRSFPWPKSMRWGDYQPPRSVGGLGSMSLNDAMLNEGSAIAGQDTLRWVRPLRGIVCTLATQHDTAEIVHFDLDAHGLKSGDVTFGHRFMAPNPIRVRRYDDYVDALQKAKVVLEADRRKAIILADAKSLAFAQGLTLVEDEALLEEVAGLVEWPVVLMAEFDAGFLDLPPEVIRATIRANQKCFVLRRPLPPTGASPVMAGLEPAIHGAPSGAKADAAATRNGVDGRDNPRVKPGDGHDAGEGAGKLANKFILVSNLVAPDGGAAIAAGNARVVRARLADARHFWQTDLAPLPDAKDKSAKPLDQRLKKLNSVIFHEKLGTQGWRIDRIDALARELAPHVGANVGLVSRAARLAKADLATEMVGEFPELQGVMGRYYAIEQHEPSEVAVAIEEHYKPQGPNDRIPSAPVSIAVALADKFDALGGFWAMVEKPTGSKDPYALRRAALGVIRIVLENNLRLPLSRFLHVAISSAQFDIDFLREAKRTQIIDSLEQLGFAPGPVAQDIRETFYNSDKRGLYFETREPPEETAADLLAFFADRLKVYLREKGARHDLIDAVFALPGQDDLLMIVRRVEALGRLLDTEDGKNLLIGYRRAANILRAEEKKDGAGAFADKHDPALLALPAEKTLADRLAAVRARLALLGSEDFEGAMRALGSLRLAVDAFFLDVTVNADDPTLRQNRLRLLNELREAMHGVADFSRVAG